MKIKIIKFLENDWITVMIAHGKIKPQDFHNLNCWEIWEYVISCEIDGITIPKMIVYAKGFAEQIASEIFKTTDYEELEKVLAKYIFVEKREG